MSYLSNQDYEFIYSMVPRICVDLLIKNPDGKVLLTKRDIEPYKDHWHLPGGRIRFRETIEEAIHRIAKQELDYTLNVNCQSMGVCQFLEESQKGSPRHSISIVYLIEFNGNGYFDDGKFFDSLPDVIIPTHREFLTKNKFFK